MIFIESGNASFFGGKNNTFQTKRTQERTLVKKKKDRKMVNCYAFHRAKHKVK